MSKKESAWEKRTKDCKNFARREGVATFLIGNTRARSNYKRLAIVTMDSFFPAEGIQIYYAVFPRRRVKDD